MKSMLFVGLRYSYGFEGILSPTLLELWLTPVPSIDASYCSTIFNSLV
jgi:hypothetical protein